MDNYFAQTISFSSEKKVQSIASEGCLMVKALSLPAGEVLEKHHTPHVLYLQALQGKPIITIYGTEPVEKDEIITLEPGMFLRIEAAHPHAVDAGDEDSLLLLHLVKK